MGKNREWGEIINNINYEYIAFLNEPWHIVTECLTYIEEACKHYGP